MNPQAMPIFLTPSMHHQPIPQPDPDAVPARVQVALRFLNELTEKTTSGLASNDVGFQEVPGQELICEEKQAQASALALLTMYFDGVLKPTDAEKRQAAESKIGAGTLLNCPGCMDKPGYRCKLCHGSRTILCYPGTE